MEKKRTDLIQTMLDQVKEELDYQDEGGEIWLYALSLNRKDLEDLLQARSYAYKLTTKVLVKMEGTDLVDGTLVDFDVERSKEGLKAHINLDFTQESPSYQGGTIEEGLKWLSRDEDWGGRELVYLDMRDPKYASYKVEKEKSLK